MDPKKFFKLRKPCANCPFLKKGAIDLHPGRLEGIVQDLISDDHATFYCHKTVHDLRTGGDWDDEGEYKAAGTESMCAGAMIYLEKINQPSVMMRVGQIVRVYDPALMRSQADTIIDPLDVKPRSWRRNGRIDPDEDDDIEHDR